MKKQDEITLKIKKKMLEAEAMRYGQNVSYNKFEFLKQFLKHYNSCLLHF